MQKDEWQMVLYKKINGFRTLIYSFDVLLPLAALLCRVLAHTTCKVNTKIWTGKEWGLPILLVSRFPPFWGRRPVAGVNCLNVVLLSQEAFNLFVVIWETAYIALFVVTAAISWLQQIFSSVKVKPQGDCNKKKAMMPIEMLLRH